MKILIEAQRIFREKKHGMDFVAIEYIKGLQRLGGDDIIYVAAMPGPDRLILEESENLKIIELKCPTYPLWEQVALPYLIRKIKPDVVHCTSNTAPLYCPAPLVVTLHDIIFLEKRSGSGGSLYQKLGWHYRRFIVPSILKRAARIVTVSEFEASRISETSGIERDKICTVYNAVSAHFRREQNYEEVTGRYIKEKNYIFFLGNTDPKKNSERVILAYAEYLKRSQERYPLLIADLSTDYIDEILKRNRIEEIRSKIYAPGYIRNSDLPFVYSGAIMFLYPSLRESFGIPQLEAMSCGTPVISSNTSAMPEITGGAALLTDPLSVESIANSILEMDHKPLRDTLISMGEERVKNFSWDKSAKVLSEIYHTIN